MTSCTLRAERRRQPQRPVRDRERRQGGGELELARQRLELQQPGSAFRNSLHFFPASIFFVGRGVLFTTSEFEWFSLFHQLSIPATHHFTYDINFFRYGNILFVLE